MPKRKRTTITSNAVEKKDDSVINSEEEVQYWLFKSEPNVFGYHHLLMEPEQTACWDGVRNYQARNLMKSMKVGDKGFFYHSNAKKSNGIVGTVEVVREAYPDHTASDKKSKYYDPKHTPDNPVWFMVDIKADKTFNSLISLQSLKESKAEELSDMMLLKRGSRLSIQPVTKSVWDFINDMAQNH